MDLTKEIRSDSESDPEKISHRRGGTMGQGRLESGRISGIRGFALLADLYALRVTTD
jgi:hypothetical protein